jgi:hypothetical protein
MQPTLLEGAAAGAEAAACMSPVRAAARRAGMIEASVPDAVIHWIDRRLGRAVGRGRGDGLVAQALHLGYGAFLGAVASRVMRRRTVTRGALMGLATWAVAFALPMPRLGVTRPVTHMRPREHAINLLAHLIYGTSWSLLTDEMTSARTERPLDDSSRLSLDVG